MVYMFKTQIQQKNHLSHKHTKPVSSCKELHGFSCLQMTRHSSVRCVSDSSLQTATFQNTRKNMGIRSLHVRSAIRCSTGRMSCWTIKGGIWKVNLLQVNLIISLGTAVEVGRLRKWQSALDSSGWWLSFFLIISYLIQCFKLKQNLTFMKNNSSGSRAINSHVTWLTMQQFGQADFNYMFFFLCILFFLFENSCGNLKIWRQRVNLPRTAESDYYINTVSVAFYLWNTSIYEN